MGVGALLGLLQGITEWLPISSEGVVAATYDFIKDSSFEEAVDFALWLHLGTVPCVLIVFRKEVAGIVRELITTPRKPSPLLSFLFVATVASGVVGIPLLVALDEVSSRAGAAAMAVIGGAMLITGVVQLRRRQAGSRERGDLSMSDGILAGLAQGVAVIPGLSRSGMTVSLLLARQVERKEALVLSFLMSVPATMGAALYAGLDSGFASSGEALVAAGIAFVVGLVAIQAVLAAAQKINFGAFVLALGSLIIAGGLWEALR